MYSLRSEITVGSPDSYFRSEGVTIFQWLTLRLFKYEIKIRQFIENQINLAREKL
jgi:hypothetical protein